MEHLKQVFFLLFPLSVHYPLSLLKLLLVQLSLLPQLLLVATRKIYLNLKAFAFN